MRDSMAKHKSKFVTFEGGQEIGIKFADDVRSSSCERVRGSTLFSFRGFCGRAMVRRGFRLVFCANTSMAIAL
jgi:hypothetical protein